MGAVGFLFPVNVSFNQECSNSLTVTSVTMTKLHLCLNLTKPSPKGHQIRNCLHVSFCRAWTNNVFIEFVENLIIDRNNGPYYRNKRKVVKKLGDWI